MEARGHKHLRKPSIAVVLLHQITIRSVGKLVRQSSRLLGPFDGSAPAKTFHWHHNEKRPNRLISASLFSYNYTTFLTAEVTDGRHVFSHSNYNDTTASGKPYMYTPQELVPNFSKFRSFLNLAVGLSIADENALPAGTSCPNILGTLKLLSVQ